MTELSTTHESGVRGRASTRPSPGQVRRLGHQPAIDGLRGVAVLAVVLYHGGVTWMSGGFLGVDAFFVVSGFLITTLLIDEHAGTGRIGLGQFWVRRIRRLVPALVLLLVGIAAYINWFAAGDDARSIRGDAISSLFYVSNWRFIFDQQSYFDAYSAPSPLRHTWSLAIEEQWYLVWPIVAGAGLYWAARRGRSIRPGAPTPTDGPSRRRLDVLAVGCLALALGSAALMRALSDVRADVSRAYFGTDTRAQALLVGAAAGFLVWGRLHAARRVSTIVIAVVGCVGLLAVSIAFVTVVDLDSWLYDGGFLVIAIGWALVVVAATNHVTGPVRRLFALAPLVALGQISYGVYLWHWPVQLVLTSDRIAWSTTWLVILRLAVTIVIAAASYHFVEQPIRRHRSPAGQRRSTHVIVGGAVAGVLVAATAVSVAASRATTTTSDLPLEVADAAPVTTPDARTPAQRSDESQTSGERPPDAVTVDAPPPARIVTVGDSTGFAVGFYHGGETAFDVGTSALVGCGVIPGELWAGNRRLPRDPDCVGWLDEWSGAASADVVLVFLGAFEVFDPEVDGDRLAVGSHEWDDYFTSQLQAGLDVVTARGARVGLMTVPCFDTNGMIGEIPSTERGDPDRIDAINRKLRDVADANPSTVTLIDWAGYVCPDGNSLELADGTPVRGDGVHTDESTTPIVWNWITEQVQPLLPTTDRHGLDGAHARPSTLETGVDAERVGAIDGGDRTRQIVEPEVLVDDE